MDLAEERARRWWQRGRPVRSLERAAAFIGYVGFALLFPKSGVALPSLLEAASDRRIERLGMEWGPDAERVWGWKDELPRRGFAWYSRFVRGHPSFLSPELLADLYPRAGLPDDFEGSSLNLDAKRIARIILKSGPTSTAALREATGAEGKRGAARFSKALTELGRALVVTHYGSEEQGAGWPSAVLELTARAFRVRKAGRSRKSDEALVRVAERFLRTMIRARPVDLSRAFGMTTNSARSALEALVDRGKAAREGSVFIEHQSGWTN
jgi:hypothetical protein